MKNIFVAIVLLLASQSYAQTKVPVEVAKGKSLIYCDFADYEIGDSVNTVNALLQQDSITRGNLVIKAPFTVSSPGVYHSQDAQINDFLCVTLTKI